ncbi:hypothetical protein CALCODRAFT_197458 [Calocera cornea HHB12733]|uniref:BZIP domain-containing protein n=1 Tax=Calocera cornea HHB12733 TaxID=1353952 RepID=A0A165C5X1_9BASI|nr:hypothetical protein CALCODRAFT_197458 [Calocera cornea HHB12733]
MLPLEEVSHSFATARSTSPTQTTTLQPIEGGGSSDWAEDGTAVQLSFLTQGARTHAIPSRPLDGVPDPIVKYETEEMARPDTGGLVKREEEETCDFTRVAPPQSTSPQRQQKTLSELRGSNARDMHSPHLPSPASSGARAPTHEMSTRNARARHATGFTRASDTSAKLVSHGRHDPLLSFLGSPPTGIGHSPGPSDSSSLSLTVPFSRSAEQRSPLHSDSPPVTLSTAGDERASLTTQVRTQNLVPLDAPIRPRQYVRDSRTSKKPVQASVLDRLDPTLRAQVQRYLEGNPILPQHTGEDRPVHHSHIPSRRRGRTNPEVHQDGLEEPRRKKVKDERVTGRGWVTPTSLPMDGHSSRGASDEDDRDEVTAGVIAVAEEAVRRAEVKRLNNTLSQRRSREKKRDEKEASDKEIARLKRTLEQTRAAHEVEREGWEATVDQLQKRIAHLGAHRCPVAGGQ